MVQPQAYKPDHDIVSTTPFDVPSNFDRVIKVIGEVAPGEIVLSVPNDDGTRFVERSFARRDAFRRRLNSAARAYKPMLWEVRRPSAKATLDWLRRTQKTIDKTITYLQSTADSENELEPAQLIMLLNIQMQDSAGAKSVSGEQTIIELTAVRVLNDLTLMRDWFDQTIVSLEKNRTTTDNAPAHQGDVALDRLVESLLKTWRDVLERKITTSVGSVNSAQGNKAGGALIRFLSIAVPIATEGNATPTNEALRARVERIRKSWQEDGLER